MSLSSRGSGIAGWRRRYCGFVFAGRSRKMSAVSPSPGRLSPGQKTQPPPSPHRTCPFRTRPLTSVKSKRLRNKRENGIDCAAGRDYNSFIRQHKPSLSAEAEFYFFIKTLIIPGRYFCPQGAELFRYFFSEFYEV